MISQNQEIETRLQILENEKLEQHEDKQLEKGESSQFFCK